MPHLDVSLGAQFFSYLGNLGTLGHWCWTLLKSSKLKDHEVWNEVCREPASMQWAEMSVSEIAQQKSGLMNFTEPCRPSGAKMCQLIPPFDYFPKISHKFPRFTMQFPHSVRDFSPIKTAPCHARFSGHCLALQWRQRRLSGDGNRAAWLHFIPPKWMVRFDVLGRGPLLILLE